MFVDYISIVKLDLDFYFIFIYDVDKGRGFILVYISGYIVFGLVVIYYEK